MTEKPLFNPYNPRNPATGDLFIGRETEIRTLTNVPDSHIILGYSRWGKTSCMKRAAEELNSRGDIAMYVSNSGMNDIEFKQRVIHSLKPHIDLKELRDSYIEDLFEKANSQLGDCGKKVYLLLDETSDLLATPENVKALRAVNQMDGRNIFLSYAIFPHIFANMQAYGSRFQDTATMIPMLPFNTEETGKLLGLCESQEVLMRLAQAQRIPIDRYSITPYNIDDKDAVITALNDYTGGFAFLLQGLLETTLNNTSSSQNINPAEIERNFDTFYRSFKPQLAHTLKALTPLQGRMLVTIQERPNISEKELEDGTFGKCKTDISTYLGALNSLGEKGVGIIAGETNFRIRGIAIDRLIAEFGEHIVANHN